MVVVITGASSGIGAALAERFASVGHNLVLAARGLAALEAVATAIRNQYNNIKVLTVQTDVSQAEDCQALIQAAIQEFGRIDVLINNAGISMRAPVVDVEIEVLERLMNVNFWGSVFCTKAALPYLLTSKGCIVVVSSIAGFKGLPERSGYSASKFALHGFFESLRIEMMPHGVHILLACPGFTQSNIRQTALRADGRIQAESPIDESKIMSAAAVADAIYEATIRRKHTLILTLQGKLTVWLNNFFPRWMDKKVYNHFYAGHYTEKKP
jgi:short-subunit dehydrogenase